MSFVNRYGYSAIGLTLISGAAIAQGSPPPEPTGGLEEIVVTARKREESTINVPVSLNVVTAESVRQLAVTNVSDLSTVVPGLVVTETTASLGGTIALRGIGSAVTSATIEQAVSTNIDGIQISYGGAVTVGQFDLSRIEVLKGPQALFFGKNSTGGVISLVTADPTDQFDAMASVNYGTEAQETILEGYVSGPLTETLGGRVAVRYRDRQGYFTNIAPGNATSGWGSFGPTGRSFPDGGEQAVRATLKFEPTDQFAATLKATYVENDSNGYAGNQQLTFCALGTPQSVNAIPGVDECKRDHRYASSEPSPDVVALTRAVSGTDVFKNSDQTMVVLDMKYDLTDSLTLNSVTGYYDMGYETWEDNSYSSKSALPIYNDVSKNTITQELRLSSNLDGPINYMVGAYYADDKFDDNSQLFFHLSSGTIVENPEYLATTTDKTYSVFAQLGVDFLEHFNLSVGARYTDEKKEIEFSLIDPRRNGTSLITPNSLDWQDTSPEATLSYRPTEDLNFYVSYREAYKAGGFAYNSTSVPSGVAAGRSQVLNFDEETVNGFEGGVKARLLDNQLRVNLSIYSYAFEGLQLSSYDPATAAVRVTNAGDLQNEGVDFDFVWSPRAVQGLNLSGAIAYNSTEYDQFFGGCWAGQSQAQGCRYLPDGNGFREVVAGENGRFQNQAGTRLDRAPEWTGSLSADYEFPVSGNLMAKVFTAANYRDEIIGIVEAAPNAIDPAFWKYDAGISLFPKDQTWKVAVVGRNLTDEITANYLSQTPFTGASTTNGTVAGGTQADISSFVDRPREIWLQAEWHF